MSKVTFEDWRIEEVQLGSPLTPEEREHLVTDTPRFEECDKTEEELRALTAPQLMATCYRVWAEYCH